MPWYFCYVWYGVHGTSIKLFSDELTLFKSRSDEFVDKQRAFITKKPIAHPVAFSWITLNSGRQIHELFRLDGKCCHPTVDQYVYVQYIPTISFPLWRSQANLCCTDVFPFSFLHHVIYRLTLMFRLSFALDHTKQPQHRSWRWQLNFIIGDAVKKPDETKLKLQTSTCLEILSKAGQ